MNRSYRGRFKVVTRRYDQRNSFSRFVTQRVSVCRIWNGDEWELATETYVRSLQKIIYTSLITYTIN
jgi:hypothetical protein